MDYAYDPIGNRLISSLGATTTCYTSNALNQYSAVSGLTGTPAHDGNLTAMPSAAGELTLVWSAENQLSPVSASASRAVFAGAVTRYKSDAAGRQTAVLSLVPVDSLAAAASAYHLEETAGGLVVLSRTEYEADAAGHQVHVRNALGRPRYWLPTKATSYDGLAVLA